VRYSIKYSFCAALLALFLGASALAASVVRVETQQGALLGQADEMGGVSFKGIPYALAPVGDLRWREPQPAKSWLGARDASAWGAKCWSAAAFGGPIDTANTSEDCLFLNVWAPAVTDKKRPVMVFIHGGGFQFGTASDEALSGASLAQKGVLVVTINYRLGVLGYLSNAELDKESKGHQSGMYGTLDQIAALKWVQQNIAAFGGDAKNVTIFGESAGAHSVGILMASPLTKGLIHKAIGQSGAFWESENGDMKSKMAAQKMANAFATKMNVKTVKSLRALPALDLQNATPWTFQIDPSVSNFSPSVDGYVLPATPFVQFKNGKQNDVPLLVGWNGNEGQMFISRALPNKTQATFEQAAAKMFGQVNLKEFAKHFPSQSNEELANSAETLAGDQVISYQTWSWANVQKKTGKSPVYVYYFNQASAYTPIPLHIADVPYVFGNLAMKKNVAPSMQDRALSNTMQTYWTNFAKTGTPNGQELTIWPEYEGAGTKVLELGKVIKVANETGTKRYEFLNKFRNQGHLSFKALTDINSSSPIQSKRLRVTEKTELNLSAAKVWAMLSNFGRVEDWHPAVSKTVITEGVNNTAGAVRHLTFMNGATLDEKIVAYSAEKMQIDYVITAGEFPVSNYSTTLSVTAGKDAQSSVVNWVGDFNRAEGGDDTTAINAVTGVYTSGLQALKQIADERVAIEKTIAYYTEGGTEGDAAKVAKAFHPAATMKFIKEGAMVDEPIAVYFEKYIAAGVKQNRQTYIDAIDIKGTAASARLTLDYPTHQFIDYFNLLKIDGQWLVVSKIFHRVPK